MRWFHLALAFFRFNGEKLDVFSHKGFNSFTAVFLQLKC